MFDKDLSIRQPAATNFFKSAIESGKLHHAFILTGSDSMEQYFIALEVAKALNCENLPNIADCTCTNCLWIKQNIHPAVITISPIDYTYGNEGSKSSTVISVNQARYLKNALSTSSQYKRVVIFTDAAEGKEYEQKSQTLRQEYEHCIKPPVSCEKESSDERTSWIPLPIKLDTFNPATPNALLKILEEPGPDLVFFFLSRDREDILETIVSRCQVVPVFSKSSQNSDFKVINEILSALYPANKKEALSLAEKTMEISKKEALPVEDILDSLQEYLYQTVKINYNNREAARSILKNIERIEQTKDRLLNYLTPQAALDSMFISFINE